MADGPTGGEARLAFAVFSPTNTDATVALVYMARREDWPGQGWTTANAMPTNVGPGSFTRHRCKPPSGHVVGRPVSETSTSDGIVLSVSARFWTLSGRKVTTFPCSVACWAAAVASIESRNRDTA